MQPHWLAQTRRGHFRRSHDFVETTAFPGAGPVEAAQHGDAITGSRTGTTGQNSKEPARGIVAGISRARRGTWAKCPSMARKHSNGSHQRPLGGSDSSCSRRERRTESSRSRFASLTLTHDRRAGLTSGPRINSAGATGKSGPAVV
jgi:hypothetical protein